jgi:hypothetical protein
MLLLLLLLLLLLRQALRSRVRSVLRSAWPSRCSSTRWAAEGRGGPGGEQQALRCRKGCNVQHIASG